MEANKMNGTVKWYNETKRFGFIAGEDGQDYFVHEKSIADGVKIREGDQVDFTAASNEKGLNAQYVDLVR